ncbi:MAG: DUF6483 family protein [Clostridiales bacterium]|jgi:hypothetical protein|nr:DUF6483 family protein [Clostridiales bacterium]
MDIIENMIAGMAQMLAKLLLGKEDKQEIVLETVSVGDTLSARLYALIGEGKINEAENMLFDELKLFSSADVYLAGLDFYEYLNRLPDKELEAANFTRAEIEQGLSDLLKIMPSPDVS